MSDPTATAPEPGERIPDAPLFRDPMHDGATDPTVVWNAEAGEWWMFYTQRRADAPGPGFGWVHGTDLGIASSRDGGRSWLYRGTARGLEHQPGRNTFWAPEVIRHGDTYHAYVSYITGVPHAWVGDRHILHYTSADLWDWTLASRLELSSDRVIDAAVWPLPEGGWRMWYKDEADGSSIHAADSPDLYSWTPTGPVLTDRAQEGPSVFSLGGWYWLVTDVWAGMAVHRSDDLRTWHRQAEPLLDAPGRRPGDDAVGNHGMCLAQDEEGYLVYFTSPGGDRPTRVQVAELTVVDGVLRCDRDAPFAMDWRPERTVALRGGDLPD
ncbi:glycosyl hydrolase [Allostreptomyces psammosilenae]|uniref:Glycosyl hydrolase n=1 Tax=Allostreptomyces psammosilenae TaxID=1892865 RepID=A0A853A284_9ACTN|nr:glycosyl hydrolase [Allostreptomyces psammosilenae]NYI04881.1 hypothetical protein [Allostreptomyces psammosilenae]